MLTVRLQTRGPFRRDAYFNRDDLLSAAQRDSLQRRDIGIVAAPSERNVPGARHPRCCRPQEQCLELKSNRRVG